MYGYAGCAHSHTEMHDGYIRGEAEAENDFYSFIRQTLIRASQLSPRGPKRDVGAGLKGSQSNGYLLQTEAHWISGLKRLH